MGNEKQSSLVEGPVFGSLIRFAGPVLGALILQAAYGAVDLMVVGRFGDAASISAVGTGSTFMQMITCVIISLAMGATVTIGQHIGEKKPEEAGNAVGTTIILFAVTGVVLKLISFILLVPSAVMQSVSAFVAQISSLFATDAEVIAQSADYLRGFSADCILTCILFSSIGYFNGCGKSIPVMVQGISSAFCVRIPVSIFASRLPGASLVLVGLATPITTVYGIIFFLFCFAWIRYKEKRALQRFRAFVKCM